MAQEGFKRKLAAIFSADAVDYSRLMGEDEEATVRTLKAYRAVLSALIKQHSGQVLDSLGDNLLAEFASVVEAVQCAVTVQKEIKARNDESQKNRRMQFRIGINLGDVIQDEGRIYGDGVNIAARLEGLAEPGGICISKTAFDQIETKLPLRYEYLGKQPVKNIAKPVRVYRILMEPRVTVAMDVTSLEKMAYPLPDKPSIAVLPFVNISGDPEQEYFSDGLTDEIITTLSKIPQLFVIARNSTFTYKGKPTKIQHVGRELGVRYVLEGSVKRFGDRIRINAQLIDAATGHHLWAERYDRAMKDLFALQDEITMKIQIALRIKLTDGAGARQRAKGTDNLEAYEKNLQAREYFLHGTKEDNVLARQMGEEAIALDPKYAYAYIYPGWTHARDAWLGWSKSPKKSIQKAFEFAQKTLALDDSIAATHNLLAFIYLMKSQYEKAITESEKAIALSPYSAGPRAHLGIVLQYAGRPEEAIAPLKKAIRLNPIPPSYYLATLGQAYRLTGRYEQAVGAYKKALDLEPDHHLAQVGLTITYSLSGREDKARAQAAEVLRVQPKFSIGRFAKNLAFKDQTETERVMDALRKAGLPE